MSDIVEWLRECRLQKCQKAADEIERLRAELAIVFLTSLNGDPSVKDEMMDLWVVGKVTNADLGAWELQGIFSSEKRALAAAVGKHDFIGRVALNQELPREETQWACGEAWYPNLEAGGSVDE